MEKKGLEMVAGLLLIVGGLNWGLVGLLNLNVVSTIFASVPIVSQLVYILVGVSALVMLYSMFMKK